MTSIRGTESSSPAGRKLEARALLVKQKAAPRTLDDVREELGHSPSWLEGTADREARLHELREERLELMIRELPGIDSAHMILSRPATRYSLGPGHAERTTAVVHLRPEDGVPLAHSTVESIRNLVISQEPDLRDSLTIQDVDGHTYLMAGEPDVGARTHALAIQEEWARQIRERLKEIDGLRVFITLDTAPSAEPAPIEPAVGINAPLGPAMTKPTPAKAMVLAQVPIRYYRDRYHFLERPDHEPSPLDLQPYVEKTERVIQLAVKNAIPPAELGDVKVTPIDVPGPPRPVSTSPAAELRRLPPWWPIAAVGAGFAAATIIGLIGRWLTSRRPAVRPTRARGRVGFGADSPGPSERVRDLVRRDPEAAAGVLHRWIGAGETGP